MRRVTTATAVGAALAVLLAACANGDEADTEAEVEPQATQTEGEEETDGQGDDAQDASEQDSATDETGPESDHEVASAFGSAQWSHESDEIVASAVTPDAFFIATDETVTAISAAGEEIWETDVTGGPDATETVLDSDGYPALRVLDDGQVVAFAKAGASEGEGLSEASAAAQVSLIDATDGSEIDTVEIPGDGDIAPAIGPHGLAFTVEGSGESTIVNTDGSTETVEDGYDAAVIGDTVLTSNMGGAWEGPGWSTDDLAPDGGGTVGLIASDDDDLVIIDWTMGTTASTAVVRASTGEVIDEPDCEVPSDAQFSSSPNGEISVVGPLRIQDEEVECFGGGDDEMDTHLRAVLDDGTAFGVATADDQSVLGADEFLQITPDGDATTEEITQDGALPVGVMSGDLVINVSSDPRRVQTVTANPAS